MFVTAVAFVNAVNKNSLYHLSFTHGLNIINIHIIYGNVSILDIYLFNWRYSRIKVSRIYHLFDGGQHSGVLES